MEEKERYEWNSRFDEAIKDNQTGDIVNAVEVLNKQYKRIKELDAEKEFWHSAYQGKQLEYDMIYAELRKTLDENQQLKQQLAESERKLEEYKKCNCKECMTDYEKNLNQIIDKYLNKNIKLKNQLHDLPNKIVGEIKTEVEKEKSDNDLAWLGFKKLNRILDTILKKYGGEDE